MEFLRTKKTILLLAGVILIILVAVGTSWHFYSLYTAAKNPETAKQQEVTQIVSEVGKLITLPEKEQPTVATVSDTTKLADQPFFTHAENGDKLLIYANAKKAILYRPTTKKIVEVSTLNDTQGTTQLMPQPSQSAQMVTPQPLRVAFLNGSTVSGLASNGETKAKEKIPTLTTSVKGNAEKRDYTDTVVVDLTGKFSQQAALIATAVGGKVGPLPTGETAPKDTDIIVILGQAPVPTP